MGRSRKRKRDPDVKQRHVEGHVLPLLYPSSRLCTLHDLLVTLLLPSLQEYHPPSFKPTSNLTPGPEVLLPTMRVAGTNVSLQHASLGCDLSIQQGTHAAVASPPRLHASLAVLCTDACQAPSSTSVNVLNWNLPVTADSARQQVPPTLGTKAALFSAAHLLLVREGDPPDYVYLLHQSYGVLPDSAPPIGSTVLEQRWSHQQVIDRVIQILFKQGRNNSNVLCFGFQQPRPRSSLEREKTAPAGLACVMGNAAVSILNSETWQRIHSRVGDLIMLHLLSHADIFHPLPHKCYVQVAGVSVLLSAQQFKKPSKWVLSTDEGSTETQDASVEQGGLVGSNGRDRAKGSLYVSCGANSCPDARNEERFKNVSAHDWNAGARKRQRPHSWQRRKMRRLTAGQANKEGFSDGLEPCGVPMEADSQEFLVKVSEFYHSSFLDVSEGGPATQGKFVTSGPFSQQSLLSDAATLINSQPNDVTEDRQQGMAINASKPFPTKPSNGDAEEQGRKGEKFGLTSARFCDASRYHVGIKAGRRFIDRSRMFYRGKFPHHAGLPKSHLLRRLKPTSKDALILFKAIFGKEMSNTFTKRCFLCLKKCSKCMCCLLKKLMLNARRCQFARFLKRHCTSCATSLSQHPERKFSAKDVKVKVQRKMHANQNEKLTAEFTSKGVHQTRAQEGFVGMEKVQAEKGEHGFTSHSQVVAFIWAVCRRIVPEELLGSKKNWRSLRRNVYEFVSLRRHESFSLAQGMFELRLSEYSWYSEQCLHGCPIHKKLGSDSKKNARGDHLLKRSLLESWIYWLLSGLIVPLIQAHFYVTESEKFRQNVLFYRKPVWAKIKAAAVKEMVKCNFKKLSMQSTLGLLKKGSLGFSRGRLLPKKVGTRLIANLGSSSTFPTECQLNKVAANGNVSMKRKRRESSPTKCANKLNSREPWSNSLSFKPINLVLRDIHNCLKFEQEKHDDALGCSVFDYNDAYLKLLPYMIGNKRVSNAIAPFYLVVCDALKAFDTIKQDKLLEIVCEFVREEEYCVRRFGYASPNMKSVKVLYERATTSKIQGVTPMDSFLTTAEKQRNAVCIDLAYSVKLRRNYILQVLKEHIMRNILQIGQHYYLQVVGIPQGSILSSLLCSLYYGHFERSRLACTLHLNLNQNNEDRYCLGIDNSWKASSRLPTKAEGTGSLKTPSARLSSVNGSAASANRVSSQSCGSGSQSLPFSSGKGPEKASYAVTKKEPNIMLRLMDDWLFISNSQDDALEFVRRMHRGFSDYNCAANRLKTAVNFDAAIGGSAINMNLYRTQDGACFIRWSGLLINCYTLEIQADYTRYCGVNVRSTLTVWRRNNEGIFLMTKLCQFMRPKCHPIFYDGHINCPATVFLNAYQAFILCAMKFHAYNCSLPCRGKCNSRFGFKAVLKCARYMRSLLAHRTHKISKRSQVKPLLLLEAKEAQWLALRAFHKVLLRKQSRYTRLLSLIKSELLSPKYEGLSETPLMLSALDARRSSMFENIIY